jgi:hypothetical protein
VLRDANRAAGQQEEGAGPETNHQGRVLAEALADVERVTQLVGRALELGLLGADG